MTGEQPKLSAYMITFNNIRTVEAALQGLRFADELVVVDSHSTDGTLECARQYADRVIERDWPGFRDQYQFAQDQCSNDWVMFADADEVIPPVLRKEVQDFLAGNGQDPTINGCRIPRRTCFVDRWIRHGAWMHDREIRLYRRAVGRWEGGLHACVHVDGLVCDFNNLCDHYSYADIEDQLNKLNSYSSIGAADLARAGKRVSPAGIVGHTVGRFVRDYFIKRGFLDGVPGLIIAFNNAASVFNKYAKLWECQVDSNRILPTLQSSGRGHGSH